MAVLLVFPEVPLLLMKPFSSLSVPLLLLPIFLEMLPLMMFRLHLIWNLPPSSWSSKRTLLVALALPLSPTTALALHLLTTLLLVAPPLPPLQILSLSLPMTLSLLDFNSSTSALIPSLMTLLPLHTLPILSLTLLPPLRLLEGVSLSLQTPSFLLPILRPPKPNLSSYPSPAPIQCLLRPNQALLRQSRKTEVIADWRLSTWPISGTFYCKYLCTLHVAQK